MDKTDKQSMMVRVPLPGGRVARVPLAILESYHVEGIQLAHDPNESQDDVTAHGVVIDQATGASVWHTDTEFGPCDYVDDHGYHHSTIAYHRHPYGTEFTEILSH
jgi:hypothetical protein